MSIKPPAGSPGAPTAKLLSPNLSLDEVGKANHDAQIEGTVAGVGAAMTAWVLGARGLKLGKNGALLGGLVAGVGCGYFWAKGSLEVRLAEAEQRKLAEETQARSGNEYEGGHGGQESLRDPYATTSGDH